MKCPECKSVNISTSDTRHVEKRNSVRRRKKCLICNHKWTTFEINDSLIDFFEQTAKKYKETVEQRFLSARRGVSKRWTSSEDEYLIALYDQGLTYSQIAEKMERPYNGIDHRLFKLRKAGRI